MAKVKVIIEDGVVQEVFSDQDTDIIIVNFDSEDGDRELLQKEYEDKGLQTIPFTTLHCNEDDVK